jgi:hypothetical protein
LKGPQLQEFANLVGNVTVSSFLSTELGATTTNAIQQLVQLVQPITNSGTILYINLLYFQSISLSYTVHERRTTLGC